MQLLTLTSFAEESRTKDEVDLFQEGAEREGEDGVLLQVCCALIGQLSPMELYMLKRTARDASDPCCSPLFFVSVTVAMLEGRSIVLFLLSLSLRLNVKGMFPFSHAQWPCQATDDKGKTATKRRLVWCLFTAKDCCPRWLLTFHIQLTIAALYLNSSFHSISLTVKIQVWHYY